MPQILVMADSPRADGKPVVTFIERVSVRDFESGHFQAQLVERLGWAVGDADAVEQSQLEARDASEQRDVDSASPVPLLAATVG